MGTMAPAGGLEGCYGSGGRGTDRAITVLLNKLSPSIHPSHGPAVRSAVAMAMLGGR